MSLSKNLCMSVGVVVALAASVATAQTRDAGAKMRGEFGSSPRSGGMARSMGPVYRAPVVVRNDAAPAMVAETPNSERTFSYEPGQVSVAGGGCGAVGGAVQHTAPQAQSNARTYSYQPAQPMMGTPSPRTYSYEPSRAYYGSGMTGGRSNVPSFALPRTDPRKHSGGR